MLVLCFETSQLALGYDTIWLLHTCNGFVAITGLSSITFSFSYDLTVLTL